MTDAAASVVLIVDDEPGILRALRAALEARHYQVLLAATGREAIEAAATYPLHAIILDLGLPDLDGIEVTTRIRQWSEVPIIVLTVEGAEDRRVTALDAGADDYVTKPFSMPELLARVGVALRHPRRQHGERGAVLHVGDVRVDLASREAWVGSEPLDLTPKEFTLLATLARHPGRVLTHRMLLQEVWGPAYGSETQYLRVFASQLRKKLKDDAEHPRLITEPGVGYRLVNRMPDPDV
jgi:two-component system KDP operon response regulator KdpE